MKFRPIIKFSHEYPKLWGQRFARLVFVDVVDLERELNSGELQDLLEYDTRTAGGGYYELPLGDLIQLVFLGDKKIPFCTLRRFTKRKFEYYRGLRGREFEVKVFGCGQTVGKIMKNASSNGFGENE